MKNCRKIFKNSEYNGTNGKRRQTVESTDKWKRMNTATFEGNKTQFELCSEIKKNMIKLCFLHVTLSLTFKFDKAVENNHIKQSGNKKSNKWN